MTLALTCHGCHKVIEGQTEGELVELGQAHAAEHGHHLPPPREHVLARIRHHNQH
jgi:hypothetical protein